MRTTTILATMASAVAAIDLHIQAVEGYDWDVANWSAGCAKSGCYYDFNVSGPADDQNPPRPAFLAYCSGQGEGASYEECTLLDEADVDRRVVAKLLPAIRSNDTNTSTIAQIQVSFQYTDLTVSTTWWNFTGHGNSSYNQFVAPLQNFTIKPDTISGVA